MGVKFLAAKVLWLKNLRKCKIVCIPRMSQGKPHNSSGSDSESVQSYREMVKNIVAPYDIAKQIKNMVKELEDEIENFEHKIKTNNNIILENRDKIKQYNQAFELNYDRIKQNNTIFNQNWEAFYENKNKITENEQKILQNKEKIVKNKKKIEQQTGKEIIKADNKNLKKKNKDLQTLNGELQTKNKDLQTKNEELQTKTEQIRTNISALQQVNLDLTIENGDLNIKMKRYKNEIEELKEPGSIIGKWIIGFDAFKKATKAPKTFASETLLWQKHVEYFLTSDNAFGRKKFFISGLFVYPAFQKLCSENIKPVEQHDCNLYSVTKRLFDLDPFPCVNEAEFQSKIIDILSDINIFEVTGENFSSGPTVMRADISISKNQQPICLIELKHFGDNCDPIYQIGLLLQYVGV